MSNQVPDKAQSINDQQPQAQPQISSGGGMQSSNILGSKISLITNALVRYEGVLSEVDPTKKSMTLIIVKSFGTEGRRQNVNEIPAIDTEIPEVQFKVDQIKDFKIVSKPDITLLDPAIIEVKHEITSQKKEDQKQGQQQVQESERQDEQQRYAPRQQHEQREQYDNPNRGGGYNRGGYQQRGRGRGGYDRSGGDYQQRPYGGGDQHRQGEYQQRSYGGDHYQKPYGGDQQRSYGGDQQRSYGGDQQRSYGAGEQLKQQQNKKQIGELDQNPNQNLKDQLKETFNFDEHIIKEEQQPKEEEKSEKKVQEDGAAKPKYDKSIDFFDAITNSTQQNDRDGGGPRDDTRKRDAETFGFQSSSTFSYSDFRGRGRGGRGGNRGGYRGGNRGGNYYQDDNFYGGNRGGRGGYSRGGGGYTNYDQSNQDEFSRGRGNRGRGGRGGFYQPRGGENGEGSNNFYQNNNAGGSYTQRDNQNLGNDQL